VVIEREADMTKQIACGDVVSGCSFTAAASDEKELMQKVSSHARDVHGVNEVTPELAARLKAAVRDHGEADPSAR
jgi:predicted small metal-binding protein